MDGAESKQKLVIKYKSLLNLAKEKGLGPEEVRNILQTVEVQKQCTGNSSCNRRWLAKRYVFLFMFIVGVISSATAYYYKSTFEDMFDVRFVKCLVEQNELTTELSRPLVKCDMCRNLNSVPVEQCITARDFKRKYAYSSLPVLIKDATNNWSAMSTFSFQFFKNVYSFTEGALANVEHECQFFPYNTDFKTLEDVFNMSDTRANFTEGEAPWYIGWSNCHKDVKAELRKHYERPYFLPNDSESSSIDWIFMGGSGPGALVHLDYVQRPSWQAQISGTKTWTLIPSPECESECKALNVTVHKGDIFVVDTNVWYHSTFIHPGEISITIGSEYD